MTEAIKINPPTPSATTAILLDTIVEILARHVVFTSDNARVACALWVLHSYTHLRFDHTPILLIVSPEKRCGKSTLLSLLGLLVREALMASSITASALFRVIEKVGPTLLIDEADNNLSADNNDLNAAINAGFSRHSSKVYRCNARSNDPESFETFCPKVFALIEKRLRDTLIDRSIRIPLRRKLRTDQVERLRLSKVDYSGEKAEIERWAEDANLPNDPTMPDTLNDRQQDLWEPLIAIADLAGAEWPERARSAAIELSGQSGGESTSTRLLADIRELFAAKRTDRMQTKQIIGSLTEMEGRPWAEHRTGKAITAPQLAALLRRFDIRPGTHVFYGGKRLKGYLLADFQDAFARYLPQAVTPLQVNNDVGFSDSGAVTGNGKVTAASDDKSMKSNESYGVTAEDPETCEL